MLVLFDFVVYGKSLCMCRLTEKMTDEERRERRERKRKMEEVNKEKNKRKEERTNTRDGKKEELVPRENTMEQQINMATMIRRGLNEIFKQSL